MSVARGQGSAGERVQFQNAQDLFSNLSADYVWLALKSTREQADSKRNELRQHISGRYHELIDSADAIVGMDKTLEEFKFLMANVEESTKSLLQVHTGLQNGNTPPSQMEKNTVNEDLTETPLNEHDQRDVDMALVENIRKADVLTQAAVDIWESIDSKDLGRACQIFLCAKEVRDSLLVHAKPLTPAGKQETSPVQVDPKALEVLGLSEPIVIGQNFSQFTSSTGTTVQPPESCSVITDVWELYPYLKSHWSLTEQARDKILQEANGALPLDDTTVDSTAGAIIALVLLGDVSPEQSLSKLLQARAETLRLNLSKTSLSEKLIDGLNLIIRTVVDVAKLFLGESRRLVNVPQVETTAISSVVTAWIREQAAVLSTAAKELLASIETSKELQELRSQLVEVEKSGGALSDAASDLDRATWVEAYKGCLLPELWQNSDEALFLFDTIFADSFVERAMFLLAKGYQDRCSSFTRDVTEIIRATQKDATASLDLDIGPLSSATHGRTPETGKEDSPEDDVNFAEEEDRGGERFVVELAGLIRSENAVNRAKAAVAVVSAFRGGLLQLAQGKEGLADGSTLNVALAPPCAAATWNLLEELAAILKNTRLLLETGTLEKSEPKGDGVDTVKINSASGDLHLKNLLFVARIIDALLVVWPILLHFVSKDDLEKARGELQSMLSEIHVVFSSRSLLSSKRLLASALGAQDWSVSKETWPKLHSGWERISVNLLEGGEEGEDLGSAHEKEDNKDDTDIVILPGTVSPGAAMFSFQVSKQIHIVGDSKFISHFKVLEWIPSGASQHEANSEQTFLESCAAAFCLSSESAIQCLARNGLSLVHELYSQHLQKVEPNEAGALQVLFDLYWFLWLLDLEASDDGGGNNIRQLIEQVEDGDHIDPINWAIYDPLLQGRIRAYRERNALLFGPTLTVKAALALRGGLVLEQSQEEEALEVASAYDSNNVLHLGYLGNKTISRIPLLPIPSTMRLAQSKRPAPRRTSGSSRTLTSRRSSGQGPASGSAVKEDTKAALKAMGQVGSNLFSQASSWLKKT
mmetsp:Transcript_13543/g.25050  ORF Transcript_13543/g.25050 Transcript_13543/m.25050 type:complete len:1043 (+) Transcript_13543:341-3469(+)